MKLVFTGVIQNVTREKGKPSLRFSCKKIDRFIEDDRILNRARYEITNWGRKIGDVSMVLKPGCIGIRTHKKNKEEFRNEFMPRMTLKMAEGNSKDILEPILREIQREFMIKMARKA